MEDDEFEFEELDEGESHQAYEPGAFSWMTPVILGVQVVEEMGRAVVDGLSGLKMSLCHHENYRFQREQFTAEASRELEQLTQEI